MKFIKTQTITHILMSIFLISGITTFSQQHVACPALVALKPFMFGSTIAGSNSTPATPTPANTLYGVYSVTTPMDLSSYFGLPTGTLSATMLNGNMNPGGNFSVDSTAVATHPWPYGITTFSITSNASYPFKTVITHGLQLNAGKNDGFLATDGHAFTGGDSINFSGTLVTGLGLASGLTYNNPGGGNDYYVNNGNASNNNSSPSSFSWAQNTAATTADFRVYTTSFATNSTYFIYLFFADTCLGKIVPINLINFTATKLNVKNSAIINWQTAIEENAANFVLEYSTDGNNWAELKTFASKGNNSSYSYTHNNTGTGIVTYRLKMVDNDGKKTYSNIARVIIKDLDAVNVYPNPAKGYANIEMPTKITNKPATITLTTIDGKVILQKHYSNLNQIENIDVSKYVAGKYFIKINTQNEVITKALNILR